MIETPAEPDVITKIKDLSIDGLLTDGAHHKQWYLEQILTLLGVDLDRLDEELESLGGEREPGIAP
jgi:hypothetical protein